MARGDTLTGKRIANEARTFGPGDYFRAGGYWHGMTPTGLLANLVDHRVEEHGDGTITASPSILATGYSESHGRHEWHGYLEHGVWRQV